MPGPQPPLARHKYKYDASTVQDITVKNSTIQYSTVQYITLQYSTVQYSTEQYSTVQYRTVQYSTKQHFVIIQLNLLFSKRVQYSTINLQFLKVMCMVLMFKYVMAGPSPRAYTVEYTLLGICSGNVQNAWSFSSLSHSQTSIRLEPM